MSPLGFLAYYICFGTVQASLSQEWSRDTGRVSGSGPESRRLRLWNKSSSRPAKRDNYCATSQILNVGTFSWDNCGGGKDPGIIKNLSIQPDPVNIPGILRARAVATTSVNLVVPLKVDLTLKKEVAGIWVKIPCVGQIGSCKYDDVCRLLNLAIPPGQECPEPLFTYGIPCHCPFKAGDYSLPETSFYIPPVELPYWLTNGNYKANAVMMNGNREVACVDLSFAMKTT